MRHKKTSVLNSMKILLTCIMHGALILIFITIATVQRCRQFIEMFHNNFDQNYTLIWRPAIPLDGASIDKGGRIFPTQASLPPYSLQNIT